MKKVFIVGNWKSNKTKAEAKEWLEKVHGLGFMVQSNREIIICPPFTLLSEVSQGIKNKELGIKIGAQNISPFGEGAYTGEISGRQIKEFTDYIIIGHSERRKNFHENEDMIVNKLEMAQKYELTPILCISNLEQITNYTLYAKRYTLIVAYEPLFAIGTGQSDTPKNADGMAKKIKEIVDTPVIYGGSVTSDNVHTFTQMPHINGVLVGGASLDPQEFTAIISNA